MDLTNEDVTDILALLDSLPYDELDLQTPRFRLTLRRTPDGWTQSQESRAAPNVLDAARTDGEATTSLSQRGRQDDVVATATRLGPEPEPLEAAAAMEHQCRSGSTDVPSVSPGDGLVAVRAPLPGTFYRAPRPGTAPFVEVGSQVGADTVVGIVETMKLFNSVTAGVSGTVAEICLGNAEFAGRGAMLLRIRAD
jgi:acetyl-CoA carboxylase biotin carboxyl carrier protein